MNSELQRKRARKLLDRAISIELSNPSSSPDAEHLVLALACCVALVSWLQAFLREKVESVVDGMSDDWSGLTRVQKVIVWRNVHSEAKQFVNELEEGGAPEEKRLDELQAKLLQKIRPLTTPKKLSPRAAIFASSDILKNNGTKALIRVVEALAGKADFRGWLGKTYKGDAQFLEEIDNLIGVRNDAAHGLGSLSVTVREVRIYYVRVRQLVRAIENFLATA